MSERAKIRAGQEDDFHSAPVKEEDAPSSPSFGIFIDFMSLFQRPYGAGTVEDAFFGAAL
eukprot:448589-Rhodomonas_salina.1